MFGTPSNWLGGVRPCQWTIVSSVSLLSEQHVELVTCVEGEAGFAVWPKETIHLGSSAVDLDAAIVDRQELGCCGADRTERMTGEAEDSGTRSAVQELSAILCELLSSSTAPGGVHAR